MAQIQICGNIPSASPSPGITDNESPVVITDLTGRIYSPAQIAIGPLDAVNRLPNGQLPSCAAGLFDIYFEYLNNPQPFGFADIAQGALRRQVFCQVFQDLSALLNHPPNNGRVNIRVLPSISAPGGPFLAAASPYFVYPIDVQSGIIDNEVYKTIVSGQDSYLLNGQPNTMLGGGLDFYHGSVQVNFGMVNYHYGLNQPVPANDIDFYQVILHEAMHLLGSSTLMGSNGFSSRLTFNNQPLNIFNRWDTFLQTPAGTPMLSVTNWLSVQPSSGIVLTPTGQCGRFNGTGINNTNTNLYTPVPWEGGASLSHISCGYNRFNPCPVTPHVVQPCIDQGAVAKHHPSHAEYEILCNLGYNLNSVYGATGGLTFFDYAQGPLVATCTHCPLPVGINDEIQFATMGNALPPGGTVLSPFMSIAPTLNDIFPNGNTPGVIATLLGGVGVGIIRVNNNGAIDFFPAPAFAGVAVIAYQPTIPAPNCSNAVGGNLIGNITYIYMVVCQILWIH